MQRQPFIVVGPGRCGTSAMAKRLIDAGVFMGARFARPACTNPEGYWEDLDFVQVNRARLNGTIPADEWAGRVNLLASVRRDVQGPWGWKDPANCDFIADLVRMFPRALYVRCRRPRERIIESMCRWYGWPEQRAAAFVDRREGLLDEHLPAPYLEVWIERGKDTGPSGR